MLTKKKDFVEIDFTGKIKESNEVFDTTLGENAKGSEEVKPQKICIGEGMLIKGFDDALEGKEIGKNYSVELEPKRAFGIRDPKLIRTIPISVFLEQKINPYPGLILNMDGIIARISSISGGRVITDFNLPLAGKTIIYDFKIKRLIEDKDEKLKALAEFFLGKAEAKIEDKKAIIISDRKIENKMFASKVKELLGLDAEFKK